MYFKSVSSWSASTAGPMSTDSSSPLPTLIARAEATSRSSSASLTGSSAITREVAVQRWPVEPKAPPWIATAA